MSHPGTATLTEKALELIKRGDLAAAKSMYEQICALDSQDAKARTMLGMIQARAGDLTSAENVLRQALALQPDSFQAYMNLANALVPQGKLDEAAECFRNTLRLKPELAEAYVGLAFVLQAQSNYRESVANCQEALRIKPDFPGAHHVLAVSLVALGEWDEAVLSFERALRLKPDYVDAHLGLASVLLTQGKTEAARASCDRALQLDSANIDAIALAANIAKRMGDTEKAFRLLAPLVKNGVQQVNVAVAFAMISKDLGRQSEAIALMEKTLDSNPALSVTGRTNLHFNLGMLYDDTRQYDKAFFHYRQGNMLKPLSFDQADYARLVERIIAMHTPESMAQLPRARVHSDRPVFIVGMVRSGTTLVEQILSSHPDVYGAGELPDITGITRALPGFLGTGDCYPECMLRLTQEAADVMARRYIDRLAQIAPNATRVTDKLPGNFMYLGLIESLFPGARVIHCMRDPVDTCLSAYFQDFSNNHPYAYDLSNLGAFYRGYLKLMAHWRKVIHLPLLEIKYEDLIADQERVTRSLVEFCGLEWDNRCLQFHETRRFVGTASNDQVNRPLYKHSVGRWKNYERFIGPLLAALNK